MVKITAAELVNLIARLDINHVYEYVSGKSSLRITNIERPEGPISFVRVNSSGRSSSGSISRQNLTRMAMICSSKPNYPLHLDRIFSAGGNTRSALESLLAYTPHFFICYPNRLDLYSGKIVKNLKHIMWCPDEEHPLGEVGIKQFDEVITEFEVGIDFGYINVTKANLGDEFSSIAAKTIHIQMQIALIEIGNALNLRTWIARNDRGIQVRNGKLGDLKGVIQSLDEMDILYRKEIKEAASYIDCIWFSADGNHIPAVIEIEHSTGVTSGLTRMQKLRDKFPAIMTNFTVVAPDQLRNKVVDEANQKIFRNLKAKFMPYTTVRELYGLIQRYPLTGVVNQNFIYPFMEEVVQG